MKQICLAFIVILLVVSSCKQGEKGNGNYTINGKIDGAEKGEMIVCRQLSEEAKPDTAYLSADGSFTFKGSITEPLSATIYFPKSANVEGQQQQVINFFVEKGDIEINAKRTDLQNAIIKGGDCNKNLQEVMNIIKPYGPKMIALSDSIKILYQAKDMESVQRLQHSAIAMEAEENKAITKHIKDNPKSYSSAYFAYQLNSYETNLDAAEAAFLSLDASIQSSYYAVKLKKIIDGLKSTAVGTKAPDFTAPTVEGKTISLSSFKGKYVLLDFWASWCGPCREENPNVVKAYAQFKNRNFAILSFSLDDNKDAWQKAILSDNLSWTQVSDLKGWQSPIAGQYGIQAIPSNVLIDPDGKVIGKDLRGSDLLNTLSSLFK